MSKLIEDGPREQPPINPFPEESGPLLFVLALYADPTGSHVRCALDESAIPEGVHVAQVLTNALRGTVSVGARVAPETFGAMEKKGEDLFG